MFKIIVAINFVLFCLIENSNTTNSFLRTLFTTTPASSHISDFRQQRRTDSRADKPDTFPGFDLQEDTTLSPRKKRRQAYSQLIRGFLEKTRERLDTIRDVVKDEKELHLRILSPDNDNSSDGDINNEATFADFSTDSDDDDHAYFSVSLNKPNDDSVEQTASTYSSSISQKYFTSLLSAIGFDRIPMPLTPSHQSEKQITPNSNIVATYLCNPLLDIWHSARKKLNFNLNYHNDVRSDANGENDIAKEQFIFNSFDSTEMNDNKNISENETNDDNIHIIVDNVNHSLPFIFAENRITSTINSESSNSNSSSSSINSNSNLHTDTNETITENNKSNFNAIVNATSPSQKMKSNGNTQSTRSNIERAALAFQNAFLKYSNYMGQMSNKTNSTINKNAELIQMNNINDNGFWANFLNENSKNIQVVPLSKEKTNDTTSTTNELNNENERMSSTETAGIFILEIFGTVIGLTWGAFSQVQNFFNNRNNGTTS